MRHEGDGHYLRAVNDGVDTVNKTNSHMPVAMSDLGFNAKYWF